MCRKNEKETNFSNNIDDGVPRLDLMTALAAVTVNLWVPKPPTASTSTQIESGGYLESNTTFD
jgi:hypothetical protein